MSINLNRKQVVTMGAFSVGNVRRPVEIKGQVINQAVKEANIELGKVLLLDEKFHTKVVTNKFGETFQDVTVRISPVLTAKMISSDPEMMKQFLSLKHGDIVNATGLPTSPYKVHVTELTVVSTSAPARVRTKAAAPVAPPAAS